MQAPKLEWTTKKASFDIEFEVITPVFGGGVFLDPERPHQKEIDPRTPVRGASVRGQLRFWWRATKGCMCDSVQSMLKRETELWGNASTPGTVSIAISYRPAVKAGPETYRVEAPKEPGRPWRASPVDQDLAYGAFSTQPQSKHLHSADPGIRAPGRLTELGGKVSIRVQCSRDDEPEMRETVKAWTTFGAIGGRTRRGFGAVAAETPLRIVDIEAFLAGQARLMNIPSLKGAQFAMLPRVERSALDALRAGLRRLRGFRQGVPIARNPGSGAKSGRSLWPEPDLIRHLTKISSPAHRSRIVSVDSMPRAAFGMPIVFHFQGGGEPGDSELRPQNLERMASPLLLRPIRVAGGYQCMAVILRGTRAPASLELRETSGSKRVFPVRSTVSLTEALEIRPLKNEPDPLQAFLTFFAST